MILKYIILSNKSTPILFPREPFTHSEVAKNLGDVKSAGFCIVNFKDGKLKIKCFGDSSTLKIKSNPKEDNEIIKNFITNGY